MFPLYRDSRRRDPGINDCELRLNVTVSAYHAKQGSPSRLRTALAECIKNLKDGPEPNSCHVYKKSVDKR